jgi:hypothetical protein
MAQALEQLPTAASTTGLAARSVRLHAPALEHVWLGLAVVAAALACALQPLEAIDYWWSVRLGALIRELGVIPADDPTFYTPIKTPILDGQWLGKVVLSVLHDLGGVQLSLALRTVVAVTAALLLARACRAAGAGPRLTPVVVVLSALLFVPGLAVRPQLLAVIPFLVVWRASRQPPRSPIAVGLVSAVVAFWANVHGSFVLIYPLLAVSVLEGAVAWWRSGRRDPLHRALILTAGCGLAPLVNPYGPGLASYVSDAVLVNSGTTAVGVLGMEWAAPAIRTAYGAQFYGSIVLVVLLLAAGYRPRLGDGLLLLGFGLLAVSSVRHVLWWSLVVAPVVAGGLHELTSRHGTSRLPRVRPLPPGSPVLNVLCIAVFGLLVAASLPWWRERLPLPASRTIVLDPATPVEVGDHLAAREGGARIFGDSDWTAYLSWRLGPEAAFFVDDRYEIHPTSVWEEYVTISRGHVSWERRLDAYGVTGLALNRATQAGLIAAAHESTRWRHTYEDRQAVVFVRTDLAGSTSP